MGFLTGLGAEETPDGVEHYDNTVRMQRPDSPRGVTILTDSVGENKKTTGGNINDPDNDFYPSFTVQAIPWTGTEGESIPVQVATFTVEGGLPPYSYSASNLPPGILFDELTGKIYGVPSEPGSFDVTFMIRDSSPDHTIEITDSITILPGSLLTD